MTSDALLSRRLRHMFVIASASMYCHRHYIAYQNAISALGSVIETYRYTYGINTIAQALYQQSCLVTLATSTPLSLCKERSNVPLTCGQACLAFASWLLGGLGVYPAPSLTLDASAII